jgi:hypothetical protein
MIPTSILYAAAPASRRCSNSVAEGILRVTWRTPSRTGRKQSVFELASGIRAIRAARVDKPGSERQNRDAIRPAARCFTCCGLPVVPEWRNWQTRQLQELVLAREWRFESSFGHQNHPEFPSFPRYDSFTVMASPFLEAAGTGRGRLCGKAAQSLETPCKHSSQFLTRRDFHRGLFGRERTRTFFPRSEGDPISNQCSHGSRLTRRLWWLPMVRSGCPISKWGRSDTTRTTSRPPNN